MDLVTLALAKNYTDEVVEESGGAGSADQVQADWNQSDETAPDYIKNRTHYYYNNKTTQALTFLEEPSTDGWYHSSSMPTGFNGYQSISGVITVNGENYNFTTYNGDLSDIPEEELIKIGTASLFVLTGYRGYWYIYVCSTEYFPSIEVTIDTLGAKQLDEKFIPDIYIKKNNLEQFLPQQEQVDWDEIDENKASYIKNRTHYKTSTIITKPIIENSTIEWNKYTDCGWYTYRLAASEESWLGKNFIIVCQGTETPVQCGNYITNSIIEVTIGNGARIHLGNSHDPIDGDYHLILCSFGNNFTDPITIMEAVEDYIYTPLDERYIPDTIARQADIEHISSIVDYGKVTNPTLSSDLIISPTVNEILLIKDLSSFEGSPLLDYYTYSYVLDGKNTYSPMIHYTTTTSIDSSYWLLDKPSTIYQMSTKKVNFYHKIGTVAKVYFVTELASLSDSELTKFPQLGIYLEVLKNDKIASLEVIYNHITKLGDQFLSNRAQGAIERVEKEFDTKLGYIDIKTDIMEWMNNQSFPDLGSDFLNQAVIVYNMGIYIGRNYSYGLYSFLGGEARVFQPDVTTLNGSIYVELYWVNQYLCKIIIPESSDEQLMGQFSHLLAPMTVMLNFEGSNTLVAFWSNDMTDITDIKNQIVGDIVDVEDPFAFWIWIGWKMRHREDIMIGTYYSDEYSVKYDFTSLAALTITLEDNSIIKLFIDESNNYCGEVTLSNGNSKLLYKATDLESYEIFQQIDYKPTGYAEPTEDTGVANKKYVDDAIAAALANLGIAEEGAY